MTERQRCLNGATCRDYAVNGVPMYQCVCRAGFNGSRCQTGSRIIRLSADHETINVKLVIGKFILRCFIRTRYIHSFIHS